jgi:hypothetical protein
LQKITLNKTIAARRLSKTGVPTPDPESTIPFGAILERVERERDMANFRYLTETYQCKWEMLASAVDKDAMKSEQAEAVVVGKAAAVPRMPHLEFEKVTSNGGRAGRAKVPGGWLVWVEPGGLALAFVPDPEYKW